MFLKNAIQRTRICHNVAAMILVNTGWNGELNVRVSLFSELIIITSSKNTEKPNKVINY